MRPTDGAEALADPVTFLYTLVLEAHSALISAMNHPVYLKSVQNNSPIKKFGFSKFCLILIR